MFWLKNKKIIFLLHFTKRPEVCVSTCSCLSMREEPSYIVIADFAVLFLQILLYCFCRFCCIVLHVHCGLLTVVFTFALAVNKNVGTSRTDPEWGTSGLITPPPPPHHPEIS